MEKEIKKFVYEFKNVEKAHDFAIERLMPLYKEMVRKGLEHGDIIMSISLLAAEMVTLVMAVDIYDDDDKELTKESKKAVWDQAKKVVTDMMNKLP